MAKAKHDTEPVATFKKSTAREYFESICVAVILALFVRTFVVQAFKIPTGSMENNLLVGDHLLVDKFVFSPAPTAVERALLIYWSYESAREDYVDNGFGATVKRLASVVTHFFTRTRWERLFNQIR